MWGAVRHTPRHRLWPLSSSPDLSPRHSAVIVQSSQYSTWPLSEESAVDVAQAMTLKFRGLSDCHQLTHSYGTRMTAMTKRDFVKDDQRPQRSFGEIVRWRHTRIIQQHEPLVLMLQNSLQTANSGPGGSRCCLSGPAGRICHGTPSGNPSRRGTNRRHRSRGKLSTKRHRAIPTDILHRVVHAFQLARVCLHHLLVLARSWRIKVRCLALSWPAPVQAHRRADSAEARLQLYHRR